MTVVPVPVPVPVLQPPSGRAGSVPDEVAVLAPFVEAGVFGPYEVALAASVVRLHPGTTDDVVVALAAAARAPRFGHVCVELGDLDRQIVGTDASSEERPPLPWPSLDRWIRGLERSDLVSGPDDDRDSWIRPLVWDGHRLYLQRYWEYERSVADELSRRSGAGGGQAEVMSGTLLEPALEELFPGEQGARGGQREAARRALTFPVSIIAGGPGTGKTYTVGRLLAAAHRVASAEGRSLSVALAAPTGKAAQRMKDAVRGEVAGLRASGVVDHDVAATLSGTDATTIHRLLGTQPGRRFAHHRGNPLPHRLIVIDETSMVSLPLMARLMDAVRSDARLVLVGDPFQLASIEAGTVLADLVGPAEEQADGGVLSGRVTVLRRMHRFGADSTIASLAESVRSGDADAALDVLRSGGTEVTWVENTDEEAVERVRAQLVEVGVEVVDAARRGDAVAALEAAVSIKVLTGTRHGPLGLYDWTDRITADVQRRAPERRRSGRWSVGRPVIVTANDRVNRVANGDVGVVVDVNGQMMVAFLEPDGVRRLAPSRLDQAETWWAMTIHKSQGSEFDHAVVALPDARSPVLTRELLYTAVTRAKRRLTVISSEASLRAAIDRPVARASGLRARLWPSAS